MKNIHRTPTTTKSLRNGNSEPAAATNGNTISRDEYRNRPRRKQKRESRKKVIVLYKCVAERVAMEISGPDEIWKIFLCMCVKQHEGEKVKTRQMLGLFHKLESCLHSRMFINGAIAR